MPCYLSETEGGEEVSHQRDFEKYNGPAGSVWVHKTTKYSYCLRRAHNLHKLENKQTGVIVEFISIPGFAAHGVAIKIIARWEREASRKEVTK